MPEIPPTPLRRRLAVLALAGAALAAAGVRAAVPDAGDGCGLRMATGPSGKVYERLFADLERVCGQAVSLCALRSEGGLQNLMKLSANEADIGIAQVDTLQELKDGDPSIATLQVVSPMHSNLLHVVSLTAGSKVKGDYVLGIGNLLKREVLVTRFSELRGLTVALVGSAQLTGRTLDRRLGYGLHFVDTDSDEQAIEMLRNGSVQAVFTLGGWPIPSLLRLRPDSGLRLVDFDEKPPSGLAVVKRNYQNLDALNESFLAVPNLLLTRPVRPDGPYGQRVAALQACLRQRLPDLQEGPFHPAWKEIRDLSFTAGVSPFVPAAPTLRKNPH